MREHLACERAGAKESQLEKTSRLRRSGVGDRAASNLYTDRRSKPAPPQYREPEPGPPPSSRPLHRTAPCRAPAKAQPPPPPRQWTRRRSSLLAPPPRVRGCRGCHRTSHHHHLRAKASTLVLIQGYDRLRQTTTLYLMPSFFHLLPRNLRPPPLCYRPTLVSATYPRSSPISPRKEGGGGQEHYQGTPWDCKDRESLYLLRG